MFKVYYVLKNKWQKTTKSCKAITLQLKKFFKVKYGKKYFLKIKLQRDVYWDTVMDAMVHNTYCINEQH